MPKFNAFRRRGLPFRSLLLVAGALMLMAAFVPKADAVLVAYFNFEDTTVGVPVTSSNSFPPGAVMTTIFVSSTGAAQPLGTNGLALNVAPGDPLPSLHALGFFTTPGSTGVLDFNVNTTPYAGFSLSFAVNTNGNGYHTVQLFYQVNGGGYMLAGTQMFPNGTSLVFFDLTGITAINNQASVDFRLVFSGGASNGQNLQTVVDNIQLNALVPEPTTIAGGLLGVLGLCWHQRRRLIRSVRFRRT